MFNFSPNNNTGFNFSQQQAAQQVNKVEKRQPQYQKKTTEVNPFSIDDLFKFKKENILYDRVMKSSQMLGLIKAQKVAHQFMEFTEPEHQVGKRLNFQG